MTVGAELALARRHLGLSLDDISARTKVSIERLEAIERTDVRRLPPPVYLMGFVRAYASVVHLDPGDTARRYLSQLEAPLDDSTASAAAASRREIVPLDAGAFQDAFESEETEGFADESSSESATVPASVATTGLPAPRPWQPRYAPLVIAAGVGVSIGLLLAGAQRWTTGPVESTVPGEAVTTDAGEAAASAPPDEPGPGSRPADDPAAERIPDRMALEALPPAPEAIDAPATPASREAHAAPDAPPAADGGRQEVDLVEDISGAWTMTSLVESSSYRAFNGLTLGYQLQLEQHGSRVVGTGYKASENGHDLPPGGRTPITLEGTLDGGRLALQFVEQGARRTSRGRFVLHVTDDGSLSGRFRSDAASSSGRAQAIRVETARD